MARFPLYLYLKYLRGMRTPAQLIRFACGRNGEKTAFIQGEREWSLNALLDMSRRYLADFRSCGVAGGMTVAVHLTNSLEYLALRTACFLGGQIFCALIDDFSPEEGMLKLEETGASLLYHDGRWEGRLKQMKAALPGLILRSALSPPDSSSGEMITPPEKIRPGDVSAYGFTSGTTGLSKTVIWDQSVWTESFYHFMLNGGTGDGSPLFLLAMPFSTAGSLNILPVMMMGARAYIQESFDAGETARIIAEKGITHLVIAPSFLYALYRYLLRRREYSLSSLKAVMVGSAVFSPAQWKRMNPFFNGSVTQSYGMAEVLAPLASRGLTESEGEVRNVGKPIPQVKIKLRERDGLGRGLISIKSTTRSRGYLGLASSAFAGDGWFHSRDWGAFDSRGQIEILGRDRDRIETGGTPYFMKELEEIFHRHPDVSDVMLIAEGNALRAFAVLQEESRLTKEELLAYGASRFPPGLTLEGVSLVNGLPLSSSGKKLSRPVSPAS